MNTAGHTRSGLLIVLSGAGWTWLGRVADLRAVIPDESNLTIFAMTACVGVLFVLTDRAIGGSFSAGIVRQIPERWHPLFLPLYWALSFGAGLAALVSAGTRFRDHVPGIWLLLLLTAISVLGATQLLRHALRLKHAVSGYSGLALGLAEVAAGAEDDGQDVRARFQALCVSLNKAMLAVTRPFSSDIVLTCAVWEPDYENLSLNCLGIAASHSRAQLAAEALPPSLRLVRQEDSGWVYGSAAAQVFLAGDVEPYLREHGIYSLTPADIPTWVNEWRLLGIQGLSSEQFECTPVRVEGGSVPAGVIGSFSSLAGYYDVLHRSMLSVGSTWAERLWPEGSSTLFGAASRKAHAETASLVHGTRQSDEKRVKDLGLLIRLWRDFRYRPELFEFTDLHKGLSVATHVSAAGVAAIRDLAVRLGVGSELDAELWALHLHSELPPGSNSRVVWLEPSSCSEHGIRLLQEVLAISRQPCPMIRMRAADCVRDDQRLRGFADALYELGTKAVVEVESIEDLALFEIQARIRLEKVDFFSLARRSWVPLLKSHGAARAIRIGDVPLVAKEIHDPKEHAQLRDAGFGHAEVRKWH